MRVFATQTGHECGPIAIYNLTRLLQVAQGGYRDNRTRLKKAIRYNEELGSSSSNLWRAARGELVGTSYRLINRRPLWNNLITQIDKAQAPAVFLAIWTVPERKCTHIAALWRPYDRCVILGANVVRKHSTAPLWVLEKDMYWTTVASPQITHPGSRLRNVWQAVRRKR